jgi:hypothetical protein
MVREIRYSEETRAAIARMIELNPELERAIFNVAELAYASIEDNLGLELRIMRATIEALSELEGQNLERIIEMAQDMIGDILQFGELGAESGYITKYCNVPSEDIRGIIDKITERWRSEYELCVSAYSCRSGCLMFASSL